LKSKQIEEMRKNSGNGRGFFGQGLGHGPVSSPCVCPQCGYTTSHNQGIPCSSLRCPTCGVPLMRQDHVTSTSPNPTPIIEQKTSEKGVQKNFPKVNEALCTGCETCLSICPTNAIVMENGKARILEAACRNCRKCVRVCPVGAIA
jgi:ferredoxin